MSNREVPCSGYLIEAGKLEVFLSHEKRLEFHDLLENGEYDEALSMLDQAIPRGTASPTHIFVLNMTDTGDEDMEENVPYACFDEEDLYTKRAKTALINLHRQVGEVSEPHRWSIWC